MLEFNNDEKKCNNEIFPAPSAVRVERGGAGQRRSSPELLLHLRSVDTVDPAAGNQARVGLDSLELFAECWAAVGGGRGGARLATPPHAAQQAGQAVHRAAGGHPAISQPGAAQTEK